MRIIGRTKRDLLEDPASSDTIQIHTPPGYFTVLQKKLEQKSCKRCKKSVYGEFFLLFLMYFFIHVLSADLNGERTNLIVS
jgi:hypothetical protein